MTDKPDQVIESRYRQMEGDTSGKSKRTLFITIALAVVGMGGLFSYAFLGDGIENDAKSRIPEPEVTPEERRQGSSFINSFDVAEEPEPAASEPYDDPRIAELEAQIAEMRALLAAASAKPEPVDPEPEIATEETPAVATLPQPDFDKALEEQNEVLEKLLTALETASAEQERRDREMRLRLQNLSSTSSAVPASVGGASTAEEAERLEAQRRADAARQAELERLASPALAISGGGNGSGGGDGENSSSSTGNAFLDRAGAGVVKTSYSKQLPDIHKLIPQGTIIPAVLETAINSDLPGQLKAVIKNDVWSADNSQILIRKGSTLIGQYSDDIQLGQRRILVAWDRIITTEKKSILIGSRGIDGLGQAGLGGQVDNHFAFKFEAAFFISIFSAVGNIGNIFQSDIAAQSAQEGGDAVKNAGESVLDQYLSIPPTIYVDQGESVFVFVSQDLYL